MTQTVQTTPEAQHSVAQLRCIECGARPASTPQDFRCTSCGDLLEIFYPELSTSNASTAARLDPAHLKRVWRDRRTSQAQADQSGVWRFRELLPPVSDVSRIITLREGNTPVYELPRCAQSAGMDHLLAKHQGMNPTGSFKDTGMTVAVSYARESNCRWAACASTGNTSASMAAYAARGGLRSLVLIPDEKIAWGKLSQALDYGALTCQLRTDFDGCMRVLNQLVRRFPMYVLNSINPYRLEGQKTAGFELLERLGWQVPDHLIVPGGNLGNASALGKGFIELRELGFISSIPKISIVQAEGANPFLRTIRETGGKQLVPVRAETLATAIRIGSPASWKKAVRILQATGGSCEQVSEAEIAIAKAEIGTDGIGCEPASAVTLAGLKKFVRQGFVKRDESVVLVLTGHLLKDPEYTLKFHRGELPSTTDQRQQAALDAHRSTPIVLDANPDDVLRLLLERENSELRTGQREEKGPVN
jgi:threonine synthase